MTRSIRSIVSRTNRKPAAIRWLLPALALLLAVATMPAAAQSTQAAIFGLVKDSSGAVVPNATVTVTNLGLGTSRSTQSNRNGEYRFVNLQAGSYSLHVKAPGFKEFVVTGAALNVRQELRIDAKLSLGAVQQQVVVTGSDVSAIDTDTPTVSDSFSGAEARDLPVNTRASFGGTSAYNILGSLPGMQGDAGTGGFSLQGALPYQLELTVDGMTLKNPSGDSIIADAFPSSESISEIRADGALADAEYGDPGQVVITTKGGTNELHGTAYLYYQSSAFDAIPYTYPTTTTKPSLQGKTFGASLGGPVVFPHFYNGHNRTFFFGAYEGWRHPAQATILEKVPTALMKQGNFTQYNSSSFSGLRDPYDGSSWARRFLRARSARSRLPPSASSIPTPIPATFRRTSMTTTISPTSRKT